jgi:hypothetical protein
MDTNAIPALLWRLNYRDPEFGVYDDELADQAVRGFEVLRDAAAPALPRLRELATREDDQVERFVREAIRGIGEKNVAEDGPRVRAEREWLAAASSTTNTVSTAAGGGAQK